MGAEFCDERKHYFAKIREWIRFSARLYDFSLIQALISDAICEFSEQFSL